MANNGDAPATDINNIRITGDDINIFMKANPIAAKDLINIALMRQLTERDTLIAELQNGHKPAEETPVEETPATP